MPVLLSESVIAIEFSDLYRRVPLVRPSKPPARYPGLHESDILAYIARKIGKLKPGEKLEEEMPWRMAMGVMLEEFVFSTLLIDSDWQPGERVKDRIAGNCDGLCLFEHLGSLVTILDETKCTEKKVRSGDDFLDEWLWMHQGRAYCLLYNCTIVRWTIMFYRGDWCGSGPIIKQFIVQFSEKEIKDTWKMLLNHKLAVAAELGLVTINDIPG